MKNKLIIFIGLLVLIACIAAPVSAYVEPSVIDASPQGVIYSGTISDYMTRNWSNDTYVPKGAILTMTLSGHCEGYPVNSGINDRVGWYDTAAGTYGITQFWQDTSTTCSIHQVSGAGVSYSGNTLYLNTSQIPRGDSFGLWAGWGVYVIPPKYAYRVGGTPPPPVANFNATPSSGMVPLSVIFNDTSVAYPSVTSWLWNFGDGYTAATQNATHVYTAVGNYSASLAIKTSTNETASVAKTITVSAPSDYFIPTIVSDAFTGNLIFNSSLS
ncbi:MAG: PKD domain-containing protein, partial [Candidatus Marinimicrobia bacterium]|nr:PKD domain-containing protein [Candidatus Neomarinimicrobiota bacterium]